MCELIKYTLVVQETITAGIINSHQLRDEKRLFVWLYSILNNAWCKYLRNKKSLVAFEDKIADEGKSGPFSQCEENETALRVRQAIASLPYNQSQVIALVDLEGLSYCEVSEVLDIPIGTVMSRLHRARKNLLMKFSTRLTATVGLKKLHNEKINRTNIRIIK